MLMASEIRIRDPFILPVMEEQCYYLFGTTAADNKQSSGFDCYKTSDLIYFSEPIPAFRPENNFWGTMNFWAPEVHFYNKKYYMFATFKSPGVCRATQILVSDRPAGPYEPLTSSPVTPENWECLDGTFFIEDNVPYMVFCHEWTQISNGSVNAIRLEKDLTRKADASILHLFNATDAPWVEPLAWGTSEFPCYVTDGPFLYRNNKSELIMLWSSFSKYGYALGIATSKSGRLKGPWTHAHEPFWKNDGGHGMLFRDFNQELYLALHSPNTEPEEHLRLIPVKENSSGEICIRT